MPKKVREISASCKENKLSSKSNPNSCMSRFFLFSTPKFTPRSQQIFQTNYLFKKIPMNTHPHVVTVPLIHHVEELYKTIYVLSKKIPKRDRFGLHAKIETRCLEVLELGIIAAFETKENKKAGSSYCKDKIEVLKRLIRNEYELDIIPEKIYIDLEKRLQEISKNDDGLDKISAAIKIHIRQALTRELFRKLLHGHGDCRWHSADRTNSR